MNKKNIHCARIVREERRKIDIFGKLLGYGIAIAILIFIFLCIIAYMLGIVTLIIQFLKRYGWIIAILLLVGLFFGEKEQHNWSRSNLQYPDSEFQLSNVSINDINSIEGQAYLEQFMQEYVDSLIRAINSNDYSIVEPYIKTGSALEQAQRKLVHHLFENDVTEEMNYVDLREVIQIEENTYEVASFESIYVTNSTSTKLTEYLWKYNLEVIDGQLKLTDIQKYSK